MERLCSERKSDYGHTRDYHQERNIAACTEVYTINIPGVSSDKVTVSKWWDNRYRELYLKVAIDIGNDEFRTVVIPVYHQTFDRYSYVVENGRITITLYEIINEEPKFDLV